MNFFLYDFIFLGGDGRFTVDPVTGEVKTVGRSSFPRSGSYQLAISANVVGIVDGGVPLTQVVNITNGNLSPQFFLEEYVINMDEFSEDSIPTEGDPSVQNFQFHLLIQTECLFLYLSFKLHLSSKLNCLPNYHDKRETDVVVAVNMYNQFDLPRTN